MTGFAARNQVAIAGHAQSPIVRRASETLGAITLRTVRAAIADAGLSVSDIDGFITSPLFPSLGTHVAEDGVAFVSSNWVSQRLGIAAEFEQNPQGQLPGSVALAVNAVHSGAARHVVVYRALHNPPGTYHANSTTRAAGREQWGMPHGHFGPIAAIAMAYNEYATRYNVPEGALGQVVAEARKNGARLPWSYWKDKPLALEDYLAAAPINDPIRMFDCDIPVDGVAAFVLTSAERARDLPNRPVYVSGYSEVLPVRRRSALHWPYDDMMDLGAACMERLCRRGGVSLAEIDLLQAYDGFAPFVYFWMELAGLCPRGEAHRMVADGGIDSDRPGASPVLLGGGALGNGRMHGTPQMLECYLQLSRRAGDRQREVSLGMACQGVPHMGGAVLYSAEAF
ncbi:thiolase family protein [Novosphingobium bradum]|uniref:Thiolase family protein n=1 Tax=Novosphingobium bradum TaxID=1737444 RepID=A0ABV7IYV6_9SPHN